MSLSSFVERCGAVHLHTRYSDGSVTIDEMARTAGSVGLDFIIITDHMTLAGLEEGFDSRRHGVSVIVGYEHNDDHKKNHYLVIGGTQVHSLELSPQEYIDAARLNGAAGFLAHPAEVRRYFRQYPSYPWTAWDAKGFDGIELWNQISEWVENLKSLGSFIRIIFPRRFLRGPDAGLMARFDALNMERFVSGIGGVDAHTYRFRVGPFVFLIFPLKVELKGIRTHIHLPAHIDPENHLLSRAAIISALRRGCGFFSNYRRGDASGTVFKLVDAHGLEFLPGALPEGLVPALPARLTVALPAAGSCRLFRNGSLLSTHRHVRQTSFDIDREGVYRVEVRRGHRAWIFSNPFPVGSYPFSPD